VIDLTLNNFRIGNMPSFNNAFGTKKSEPGQGCTTAENTLNMMMPFLRMRPITITSNTETSVVDMDASLHLAGEVTSLRLGAGAYHGVELKVYNGTSSKIELLDSDYVISIQRGDTRELRWNGSDWRIKHDYHVGDLYQQFPTTKSPIEKRLEGTWVKWNCRAVWYWLSATAPSAGFIADWKAKRNDIWMLKQDGTVAGEVNQDGTPVNPVDKKYQRPSDYTLVLREVLHNNIWDDADLVEGYQIPDGAYAGMYIWQVQSLAGLFLSIADEDYEGGGFRPPFEKGVHGDRTRPFKGRAIARYGNTGFIRPDLTALLEGVFCADTSTLLGVDVSSESSNSYPLAMDSSRVLVTAPQGAPSNTTYNIFRRVL